MLKTTNIAESNILDSNQGNSFTNNGLEERVDKYKKEALNRINFTVFIKPAIISFVALIFSFFLDLAYVPILGNISVDMAKILFPTWEPAVETFQPYSFWWLPVVVYLFFIVLAYMAYTKLKHEVARTPATETIDKIIASYTTIIDSLSMALPLIGAAILLISIKLGEEVFLGLSVPFEIKALIVLALGKLFEPVLDQLGLEFQNVVNHINEMREKYYSRLQVQNTESILKQLSLQTAGENFKAPELSIQQIEKYREVLIETAQVSSQILNNFNSLHSILEKLNGMNSISSEKIEELKSLASSIINATESLSNEKTVTSLKYLESMVKK